jgi:hypothetical protein
MLVDFPFWELADSDVSGVIDEITQAANNRSNHDNGYRNAHSGR